jgi:hypothetical protein
VTSYLFYIFKVIHSYETRLVKIVLEAKQPYTLNPDQHFAAESGLRNYSQDPKTLGKTES